MWMCVTKSSRDAFRPAYSACQVVHAPRGSVMSFVSSYRRCSAAPCSSCGCREARVKRLTDAIDRSWLRVCRRLAAAGHPRQAWEGPSNYASRLAREAPEAAAGLAPIAADYARLRYGPAPADAALLKRFHNTSRKFRPR